MTIPTRHSGVYVQDLPSGSGDARLAASNVTIGDLTYTHDRQIRPGGAAHLLLVMARPWRLRPPDYVAFGDSMVAWCGRW